MTVTLAPSSLGQRIGELDRGDPSPHRLDSKDDPAAQDLAEVPKVRSNISARRVHEIELLERCGLVSHGREGRSARPSVGTAPLDEEQRRGWIKRHTLRSNQRASTT